MFGLWLCNERRGMTWTKLSTELKSRAPKLSFDVGFKHDRRKESAKRQRIFDTER